MKLSARTKEILKNFSLYNKSIIIYPGSLLASKMDGGLWFGFATTDQEFETECAIRDLDQFLTICSLFKDPDITNDANVMTIAEGNRSVKYVLANPAVVIAPEKGKRMKVPTPDVTFKMTSEMTDISKAANALDMQELAIEGKDGKISLRTMDSANPTSDSYNIEVGNTNHEFRLLFQVKRWQIIKADYDVSISFKHKVAGLSGVGNDIDYIIASDFKGAIVP